MQVNLWQLAARIVVFALTLFLPTGSFDRPAGWAFLVLFFGFVIALSLWLFRFNPELLAERMTGIGRAANDAVR